MESNNDNDKVMAEVLMSACGREASPATGEEKRKLLVSLPNIAIAADISCREPPNVLTLHARRSIGQCALQILFGLNRSLLDT